jgi:hypothetical protein
LTSIFNEASALHFVEDAPVAVAGPRGSEHCC